jgi:hypothetical protein
LATIGWWESKVISPMKAVRKPKKRVRKLMSRKSVALEVVAGISESDSECLLDYPLGVGGEVDCTVGSEEEQIR